MRFSYSALDGAGTQHSGLLDAGHTAEAVTRLMHRGLTPLTVVAIEQQKATSGRGIRAIWRRREGTSRSALVLLVRELATLLQAGVTLEESLRTLIDGRQEIAYGEALTAALSQILAGERFSLAIRRQTESGQLPLPPYVVALISAGEATGELASALSRAAEQLEFDEQVRAETSEALVYPTILVLAGAGAVLFVFSFVVPRFSALLSGRRAELPWLSSVVMGVGEYVNRHGWILTVAGLVLLLLTAMLWRAIGPTRVRSLFSRLPVLGSWVRQQELSRWTGLFALMLQSRVPILSAMDLTASSVTLPEVANHLRMTMGDVGRGESLSNAFASHDLLPASALSMVRVGERTGQLGQMMGHVAQHALEQNRRQRKRLVALIEPAAIILLGGIIALVIVGVVLALTSLSDVKF
jgi:general secretion pathway protein F